MNIYVYELRTLRKSTSIWGASIVGLTALMLSMYPTFVADAEQFMQLLSSLPTEVLQAFGVQLESLFSIIGYYSYIFTYIVLCGAIQAMNLGLSFLSKETREKTADFLLAKPITRMQIVTAKLCAAITSLLITQVVYLISSILIVSFITSEEYDRGIFLLILISFSIIQCIFFAIGCLLSVILPKIKSVLPVSLAIVFGFYIIGLFSASIVDDGLRAFTPFKYFEPSSMIKNGSYESTYLLLSLSIIVIAVALSYYIYQKKDIHVS